MALLGWAFAVAVISLCGFLFSLWVTYNVYRYSLALQLGRRGNSSTRITNPNRMSNNNKSAKSTSNSRKRISNNMNIRSQTVLERRSKHDVLCPLCFGNVTTVRFTMILNVLCTLLIALTQLCICILFTYLIALELSSSNSNRNNDESDFRLSGDITEDSKVVVLLILTGVLFIFGFGFLFSTYFHRLRLSFRNTEFRLPKQATRYLYGFLALEILLGIGTVSAFLMKQQWLGLGLWSVASLLFYFGIALMIYTFFQSANKIVNRMNRLSVAMDAPSTSNLRMRSVENSNMIDNSKRGSQILSLPASSPSTSVSAVMSNAGIKKGLTPKATLSMSDAKSDSADPRRNSTTDSRFRSSSLPIPPSLGTDKLTLSVIRLTVCSTVSLVTSVMDTIVYMTVTAADCSGCVSPASSVLFIFLTLDGCLNCWCLMCSFKQALPLYSLSFGWLHRCTIDLVRKRQEASIEADVLSCIEENQADSEVSEDSQNTVSDT